MGRILALILSGYMGTVAPGATDAPATGGENYSPPQRITAPKKYLSTNSYCRSVSNGCVVCYRDEASIRCTEAAATCTPRPAFRCNRF